MRVGPSAIRLDPSQTLVAFWALRVRVVERLRPTVAMLAEISDNADLDIQHETLDGGRCEKRLGEWQKLGSL